MIQFGNDKIKEIYVGSDKIKEVYHGSELVYSAFNGVLYSYGFEGVEWEQGFTYGTSGTDWLLDKSQNYLGSQVMGSTSGSEAAWTTKNAVDLSKFNTLRVIFDRSMYSSNRARVGIFIGAIKNQTAYGSVTELNNRFSNYSYWQSGSGTNITEDLPLTAQGEHFISINAVKLVTQSITSYIIVKELQLLLINKILFEPNVVNVGFEQGFKFGSGSITSSASVLEVTSTSPGINHLVSTSIINVSPFKTLRMTFINTGDKSCMIGLVDAKTANLNNVDHSSSSAVGVLSTLDFDISNISGEKYVAIAASKQGSADSSIQISKIELLLE